LVWVASANDGEGEKSAIILWLNEAAVFAFRLDAAGLHAPLLEEAKTFFCVVCRLEAIFVSAALAKLKRFLAVATGFFRRQEDEGMVFLGVGVRV
jgi:hypothetical protein